MGIEEKHCRPCEEGAEPLPPQAETEHLSQLNGWEIVTDGVHKIRKTYCFASFPDAILFVDEIARVVEEEQHHPDIYISYDTVTIELYTHKIGGVSENDFIMAAKFDKVRTTAAPLA